MEINKCLKQAKFKISQALVKFAFEVFLKIVKQFESAKQTNLASYVEVYTDGENRYDDKREINPQIITDHCCVDVPLLCPGIGKDSTTPSSGLVWRVTELSSEE